jgi:PhoH-like ATPase
LLGEGKGKILIFDSDKSLLPEGLTTSDSDNLILSTFLKFQKENPSERVVLVSHDINLRVRCDALGLECQPFFEDKVVDDVFFNLFWLPEDSG